MIKKQLISNKLSQTNIFIFKTFCYICNNIWWYIKKANIPAGSKNVDTFVIANINVLQFFKAANRVG